MNGLTCGSYFVVVGTEKGHDILDQECGICRISAKLAGLIDACVQHEEPAHELEDGQHTLSGDSIGEVAGDAEGVGRINNMIDREEFCSELAFASSGNVFAAIHQPSIRYFLQLERIRVVTPLERTRDGRNGDDELVIINIVQAIHLELVCARQGGFQKRICLCMYVRAHVCVYKDISGHRVGDWRFNFLQGGRPKDSAQG